MEDDANIDAQDETSADITDLEDDVLAAKPKGSSIADGSSNT